MAVLGEDTIERYLRPKAIAEAQLTAGWGDSEQVWVEDGTEGFILVKPVDSNKAVSEDGSVDLVDTNGRPKVILKSNPNRNERCEDMASMTELNDATVLHNLRKRYQTNLIYVNTNFYIHALMSL